MPQIRLGRLCLLVLTALVGVIPASAETLTLAWDPNGEQQLVGYIVYIGSAPGAYTQHVDVGNVTHHDVNATAGQRYCFAVSAYAAGPVEGPKSREVCTTDGISNTAPTMANPGAQSAQVGQPFNLWLGAVDPEGAALTYTVSGLPAGLTVASTTGVISGTPTQTGSSTATATASDGELSVTVSFSFTVSGSTPGVATLLTPTGTTATPTPTFEWNSVATATTYRVWVDDASTNQQLIRDVTPAAVGCATTGAVCRVNPGFTLVPGPASWSVRATNAFGDGPWSGSMDFTVPGSQGPTISIVTPTTATTYSNATATITLSGTATGVVQVSWTNNKGGSGNAVGTTAWSVPSIPLQPGSNVITVTARDVNNATATDVLTVAFADAQAPTIDIALPTTSPTYATTVTSLTVSGSAADNIGVTEVRWANSQGGSGVAAGTTSWSTGAIALKPGSNTITMTARDAAGNTAVDVLTVNASDAQAPTVDIALPTTSPTYATTATSLTVSGSAADNVGVTEVRWANSQGGSGVATGTTSWSTGVIALKPGSNTITITARDAAGNTTADVLTVNTSDAQVPTIDISQPTAASTYSTNSSALVLSGVASDNVGVTEVRWANSQGGSGLATGTATWSSGSIALKPGTNVITVTARDAAGNTATDTLSVNAIDNAAPTVSITNPATGLARLSSPSTAIVLSGTAADAFGVVQVTWSNNRGGSGTASGTTSWTISGIPVLAGDNIITVTARDAAGLVGTATLTVTGTDGQAPTVSVVAPTAASTYATTARTIALSGTSTDAVGVTQVTWANNRGGGAAANGTTNWTVPAVGLQLGTNVITITARDAAGNAGQTVLSVTVTDTDGPVVAIASPVAAATYSTTSPTVALTGSATDASGVASVTWSNSQGGSGAAAGTTSWTVPAVALVPGVNVITIVARDTAGNMGRAQLSITATDTRAPVIKILSNGTTAGGLLQLAGSASDDFGLVSVTWRTSRGGTGTAVGTTSWVVAGISLAQGSTDVTVTATDRAGHTATDVLKINGAKLGKTTITANAPLSAPVTQPVSPNTPVIGPNDVAGTIGAALPLAPLPGTSSQLLAPALSILGDSSWVTSAGTVPLKGTATDNVTRVTWSADWGGSGTASGTQAWTIPTVGLQMGKNVITVTATTADGRIARKTVTVTYRPRGNNK